MLSGCNNFAIIIIMMIAYSHQVLCMKALFVNKAICKYAHSALRTKSDSDVMFC